MASSSLTALNYAFRLLIPVCFFAVAFWVIPPSDILDVLRSADWGWFGIGCASVILGNYLCSLRTRNLLFENSQPLGILWHIHVLRAFITGALPFSTGELSYVYYLKKYCLTPAAEGMAILVSVRFLEYVFFLGLLFCLAVLGIFSARSPLHLAALGIICANVGLVCLVVWKTQTVLDWLNGCIRSVFGRFRGREIADKLTRKIAQFTASGRRIFSAGNRKELTGLTLGIVLLRNVFVLSMIRAMGVPISVWLVVFLFVFLFVTRFIQGFGSFGNQETGITGALLVVGYPKEQALAIAVGTHLLQWIPVLALGVVSYVLIPKAK